MSHTKGPWERCQTHIHAADKGTHVAGVNTHTVPLEEALGNAKLIASAPDLLAALRQIAIGQDAAHADLNRNDMMRLARVVINTAGL